MEKKDELTNLFRHRLQHAQMEVRDDFWETLQGGVKQAEAAEHRRKVGWIPWSHRLSAVAAVLSLLVMGSSVVWYLSPKEEIKQAFHHMEPLEPQAVWPASEVPSEWADWQPACKEASAAVHRGGTPSAASSAVLATKPEEPEEVAVHVRVTIRRKVIGALRQVDRSQVAADVYAAGLSEREDHRASESAEQNSASSVSNNKRPQNDLPEGSRRLWAWKVGVGGALPKGEAQHPWMISLTAERSLGKRVSLEAGCQYHHWKMGGESRSTSQTLAIPVHLNVVCVQGAKWSCYAKVGGALEKGLNQGFGDDPLRLSASAGVGVSYQIRPRMALFAEPMLTHHFDTDASCPSLRTERATNLNLLCGVRMTY